jgi:hypothetical protein
MCRAKKPRLPRGARRPGRAVRSARRPGAGRPTPRRLPRLRGPRPPARLCCVWTRGAAVVPVPMLTRAFRVRASEGSPTRSDRRRSGLELPGSSSSVRQLVSASVASASASAWASSASSASMLLALLRRAVLPAAGSRDDGVSLREEFASGLEARFSRRPSAEKMAAKSFSSGSPRPSHAPGERAPPPAESALSNISESGVSGVPADAAPLEPVAQPGRSPGPEGTPSPEEGTRVALRLRAGVANPRSFIAFSIPPSCPAAEPPRRLSMPRSAKACFRSENAMPLVASTKGERSELLLLLLLVALPGAAEGGGAGGVRSCR